MSDEPAAPQDDTSAAQGTAQAQAPSEGVQGLMPAASIAAETPAQDSAAAPAPAEAAPAEQASPDAGEKDLGLLGKAKPVEEGVPDQYEAFTMPDGIVFDEAETGILQSIAKESNLTQAEAQSSAEVTGKFMDALVKENEANVAAYKAEQSKIWDAQPDAAERILLADKALNHAGLRDYIIERGYQHDAQFMKMCSEFGKVISEAKVIVGSEASPTAAHNPYPNSPEFNK